MGVKASFNNQYLGIYITGGDLDKLLEAAQIYVPVFWGQDEMPGGHVWVALDAVAVGQLKGALEAEKAAMEAIRAQQPAIKAAPKRSKGKEEKTDGQTGTAADSPDGPDQDPGPEPGDGLQPASE